MKTINETFTDDEFEQLLKVKKNLTWKELIMLLPDLLEDS